MAPSDQIASKDCSSNGSASIEAASVSIRLGHVLAFRGDIEVVEKVRQEIDGSHGGIERFRQHERGRAGPAADVGDFQAFSAAQTR
jgi:hypothetical protein